jgi:hypothetical protein
LYILPYTAYVIAYTPANNFINANSTSKCLMLRDGILQLFSIFSDSDFSIAGDCRQTIS